MRSLVTMLTGLLTALILSVSASAQAPILLIDFDEVERKAEAYKNFNLKTANIREQILQLRQFLNSGGQLEQQAAELEKQKSIIGNEAYEEQRLELERQFQVGRQNLQIAELGFDRLRQEASRQIEIARQPVLRKILQDRGAQVILQKRSVLIQTTGIDVTTTFIELLDLEIPEVDLSALLQPRTTSEDSSSDASSSSGAIEEID